MTHGTPGRRDRIRVYCLPHAGGSAHAYREWRPPATGAGPRFVPLELPGRGARRDEPLAETMTELADGVLDHLDRRPSGEPFALFGHSMGAGLAYETARRLRAAGRAQPRLLVVSGSGPVGTGRPPAASSSDEELTDLLELLGGTQPELLRHRALRPLWLPVLRADLRLASAFTDRAHPTVLDCPILALGGSEDPLAGPAEVSGWRGLTSAGFHQRLYPGGHFFLHRHRRLITDHIADLLAAHPVRGI
ncbi:alpha/beta fold hydrolase [Streptomyces sp. NPDC048301]|uniref:thioesterase II family protein n=1 Tax=Streptomyces sp. NPDC048301 TaxID=3155631 RepID=UPI003444C955